MFMAYNRLKKGKKSNFNKGFSLTLSFCQSKRNPAWRYIWKGYSG